MDGFFTTVFEYQLSCPKRGECLSGLQAVAKAEAEAEAEPERMHMLLEGKVSVSENE